MLRRIAAVLFALALLVTVSGTGAYSAASADRGLTVEVVDDDEAYVGYEPEERIYAVNTTNQTTTETLVTVTNRFPSSVELTDVDVDAHPALSVLIVDEPGTLEPGESGEIRAGISCDEEVMSMGFSVSVSVDGEAVAAALDGDTETRTVSVSCSP